MAAHRCPSPHPLEVPFLSKLVILSVMSASERCIMYRDGLMDTLERLVLVASGDEMAGNIGPQVAAIPCSPFPSSHRTLPWTFASKSTCLPALKMSMNETL